jgi:hypothetical protein
MAVADFLLVVYGYWLISCWENGRRTGRSRLMRSVVRSLETRSGRLEVIWQINVDAFEREEQNNGDEFGCAVGEDAVVETTLG